MLLGVGDEARDEKRSLPEGSVIFQWHLIDKCLSKPAHAGLGLLARGLILEPVTSAREQRQARVVVIKSPLDFAAAW